MLMDAGRVTLWSTETVSASSVQLSLHNTGNLVLSNLENSTLWQSFNMPTDTLLPQQILTSDTNLISSRSQNNYSSGFYKFFFDNDNTIRMVFDGPDVSSIYWPDPGFVTWEVGRTTYNNSRVAVLNSSGNFSSSDDFSFMAADFGEGPLRRLTLDFDGNIRLYSLEETTRNWVVSWQAISQPCQIHGLCGPNSLCTYTPDSGRRCSCLPGFKVKNAANWSSGCEPEFIELPCNSTELGFVRLPGRVEIYGYDFAFYPNYTYEMCKMRCLELCESCKAFMLKFDASTGVHNCFPKTLLLNGFRSPSFLGIVYLKMPKATLSYINVPVQEPNSLVCPVGANVQLDRKYEKHHENGSLKFLLWFASSVGGLEMACIFLIWCFLFRTHRDPHAAMQGYILAVTGFKKFSYAELQKASRSFSEEIGRGGGAVVYKGILSDDRVAAIKRLHYETSQGEAEFLAEVTTIGRLNHMNVIEMWGYCAEGKHRLLVYEYMERGSLAGNLYSQALDWAKRFEIAVGTAKGLAYLHEECLEWILHCDIKPQNILLDSNYRPKVADFGLSKLLNREVDNTFSTIRGTRGYMAPEWVYNLPITSKVDVYSYGVVALEMAIGNIQAVDNGDEMANQKLVTWVKEKMNGDGVKETWIEEIIDPGMASTSDLKKMEILIKVALQCVEEDKDKRPTMSQVVEMLQSDDR